MQADMPTPEYWMKRAITIAERGLGNVAPNPLVGCVIVYKNQIIGEGWHQEYGGPHAEVYAIRSVSNHDLLKESTVYTTLEPCSHYGKTPPCANLLIDKKIPKVVIGHLDPHPLVSGKGLSRLKEAGIQVIAGVLEKECKFQNRRFLTTMLKKRPYVVLKWAQSSDGFIGQAGKTIQISSNTTKILVHKWRSEEAGILVGGNTFSTDKPLLNVRHWYGRQPVKIILSPKGKFKANHSLNENYGSGIFLTSADLSAVRLDQSHFFDPQSSIQDALDILMEKQISSILVEGGSLTLNSFIESGLWDEARILTSNIKLLKGLKAPNISYLKAEKYSIDLDNLDIIYNSNMQQSEVIC